MARPALQMISLLNDNNTDYRPAPAPATAAKTKARLAPRNGDKSGDKQNMLHSRDGLLTSLGSSSLEGILSGEDTGSGTSPRYSRDVNNIVLSVCQYALYTHGVQLAELVMDPGFGICEGEGCQWIRAKENHRLAVERRMGSVERLVTMSKAYELRNQPWNVRLIWSNVILVDQYLRPLRRPHLHPDHDVAQSPIVPTFLSYAADLPEDAPVKGLAH